MDCQGVWSSGTTYVTFEDVKVPVENLIGKENQGFKGKFNRVATTDNITNKSLTELQSS
jgi:alkylation response protein AidB-like acyl-CoA dehydrogenase